MKNNFRILFMLIMSIILSACESLFQFNPNQIVLNDDEKNLTQVNLNRLSETVKDTVRFIFMGDTQRWYDEAADFIKSANQQANIDFVVHAGDISDFGLAQEFRWINKIMTDLKVPYLTVVGNHDLIANGSKAYQKMFGPLNYSFEYGKHRFVVLNTNSREYGFDGSVPDLNWLRFELANNPEKKNTMVMGHIPPFDSDFDPAKEEAFSDIVAGDPSVRLCLFAHRHSDYSAYHYDDGVEYHVTTSIGKRGYSIITAWEDGYDIERITF